jgi:lysM domain protein
MWYNQAEYSLNSQKPLVLLVCCPCTLSRIVCQENFKVKSVLSLISCLIICSSSARASSHRFVHQHQSHHPRHKLQQTQSPTPLRGRTTFSQKVIKLTPKVETSDTKKQWRLPVNVLNSLLSYPEILPTQEITHAPRLIRNAQGSLLYKVGDRVYAKNLNKTGRYLIYRLGEKVVDPSTHQLLGTEVVYTGEAKTIGPRDSSKMIVRGKHAQKYLPEDERYSASKIFGLKLPSLFRNPTKLAMPLELTKVLSEISEGDRLLWVPDQCPTHGKFVPHAMANDFRAQVIHVFDHLDDQEIGRFETVLLNKGVVDGLRDGAILSIYDKPANQLFVEENHHNKLALKDLAFPANRLGKVIVYHSTEHVAYALVLEHSSELTINVGSVAYGSSQKDLEDFPDDRDFNIN